MTILPFVEPALEAYLRRMEERLRAIERNTASAWPALLWQGLLRGGRFTLGTLLVLALLGWVLSLLGIIPGLGDIARYLRHILQARSGV